LRALTTSEFDAAERFAGGAAPLLVERGLAPPEPRLKPVVVPPLDGPGEELIAESAPMRRLVAEIARVAPRDVTVLVRGETGTGKELVASLLHARSRRRSGPLVRVNCAAIPAELAEAELFGHARGAFTGAVAARRGYFAEADGGTLVLDELGELPLPLQAKLLRALQNGEIQPVGSARIERVDVRVVASTNRDLQAEARAGRFREDLYYRLAVVELVVPPLREHRDDIPALAAAFARRYTTRFGIDGLRLSPALVARLRDADWPGNVRQLENAVARMVALAPGGELDPEAFVPDAPPPPDPGADDGGLEDAGVLRPAGAEASHDPGARSSLREQLDAVERSLILAMLATTRGNRSEAARRLRVGRTCFLARLKKHGLM
jgi:DNA-binding NtrC family response regulator